MPEYSFKCDNCHNNYELTQKIGLKLPDTCPTCGTGGEAFYQVYDIGFVFVKGEPTTLGQQAELNAKRVGKEQMQKMADEYSISKRKAKEFPSKTPPGSKSAKGKYKRPWWRPNSDKPLDITKIKNVKKYIEEGK